MSSALCQTGVTQGFPLRLSQNLFRQWTNYELATSQDKLTQSTIPTDFSVNWQPVPTTCNISVSPPSAKHSGVLITGLESYLGSTTITYGNAIYTCQGSISIVQNQHPNFNQGQIARFEAILAFRIKNSSTARANPSNPHIILLCRPLVYNLSVANTPFWNAVDKAASDTSSSQNGIKTDISSIYAIDKSNLLPTISYKTCIPAQLQGTSTIGSVNIYVNVITQPLVVNLSSTILTTIGSKYSIPLNIGDLFSDTTRLTNVHFPTSVNTFSNDPEDNLKITLPGSVLSDFDTVLQSVQILAPESMLGVPLNQITQSTTIPSSKSKKPYKCYTIDPTKDIVDGQIMVDPTTGQELTDAQKQAQFNTNNYVNTNVETEIKIMPGDVEYGISVFFIIIGTLGLLGYLLFIVLKGRDVFNTGNYKIPGGMNGLMFHIFIFAIIFICLVCFGIYYEKPLEPKKPS